MPSFHLAKGGFTSCKDEGFTLVEVIIASTLLLTVIIFFIPLISQLDKELSILDNRRHIVHALHDELQIYLWTKESLPHSSKEQINNQLVELSIEKDLIYIKGCAQWENAREKMEEICLYGIPPN
ncbi:hypothetical protein D8M04_02085 [Oceanobacillus piezotolerans]|uniref:Prepilin-type N-terminal cleavage/methylation domain-containing protein n=1 Tax=Oceanobacillus piezotolerans TaxID=2448030 RepID=A0A498DDG8_9BACI|nr:hypothetical protein [Oceanobacillus piezotolerans]RLL48086.1 hypothetical protein D8M04_02085 [Oceanobacillus piezotolerans]